MARQKPSQSNPPNPARPPTNTRSQRRRNDRALFLAVIAVLLIGGSGLITLIYGREAFITAFVCLTVGAAVLFLLWAILGFIERWVED
ncbi:MAG: hypothetical protein ABTQ73_11650 [Caldilineales bacterium]